MVDQDAAVGGRIPHIVADELLVFVEFVVLVHLHCVGENIGLVLEFNEV